MTDRVCIQRFWPGGFQRGGVRSQRRAASVRSRYNHAAPGPPNQSCAKFPGSARPPLGAATIKALF